MDNKTILKHIKEFQETLKFLLVGPGSISDTGILLIVKEICRLARMRTNDH